ncbi:MAG: DUF2442 domain-containing protein [Vicinamibacterales bacterium]
MSGRGVELSAEDPGISGPYWFFFYSFDCDEPMHVHARRDRQHAKFWLAPSRSRGIMDSAHESSMRSVVSLLSIRGPLSRHGMSTAVSVESRIDRVHVSDDTITAHLVDGRVISVPLAWSWRLSEATPAQRANWELIGDGHGVHWPDIGEDLSASGMLTGIPARRPGKAKPQESAPADRALQPTSRTKRAKTRKPSLSTRG